MADPFAALRLEHPTRFATEDRIAELAGERFRPWPLAAAATGDRRNPAQGAQHHGIRQRLPLRIGAGNPRNEPGEATERAAKGRGGAQVKKPETSALCNCPGCISLWRELAAINRENASERDKLNRGTGMRKHPSASNHTHYGENANG